MLFLFYFEHSWNTLGILLEYHWYNSLCVVCCCFINGHKIVFVFIQLYIIWFRAHYLKKTICWWHEIGFCIWCCAYTLRVRWHNIGFWCIKTCIIWFRAIFWMRLCLGYEHGFGVSKYVSAGIARLNNCSSAEVVSLEFAPITYNLMGTTWDLYWKSRC